MKKVLIVSAALLWLSGVANAAQDPEAVYAKACACLPQWSVADGAQAGRQGGLGTQAGQGGTDALVQSGLPTV